MNVGIDPSKVIITNLKLDKDRKVNALLNLVPRESLTLCHKQTHFLVTHTSLGVHL